MKATSIQIERSPKVLVLPEKILPRKLLVKTCDYIYSLDKDEIIFLKADGNYTKIYTTRTSMIVSAKTLKFYARKLASRKFVRVHQSYLINLEMMSKISLRAPYEISMQDGSKIPISRSKKPILMEILGT